MDHHLKNNDISEHALATIGAQVSYLIHRDDRARAEALTCQPPGRAHVLPEKEVTRIRDTAKQVYLQEWRAKGPAPAQQDDEGSKGAARRRRRRAGGQDEKGGKSAPEGGKK